MKIMTSVPISSWKIDGETVETVRDFIFLGSRITEDGDCSHENKRHLYLGRKAMTNLDSILKSRDITLPTRVHLVKAMVFPVVMCGCESCTIEKAEHWRIDCFWTVMLEKTLESPLDCTEIKPINPKGNQSRIFIGRSDVEAEAALLWLPDAKIQIIGKDPDAGQDWRQEKGTTEDKMVGWHHQFNKREFEQAPGDGEGQGSLECCSPWGRKECDMTERLNNNNNKDIIKTSLMKQCWKTHLKWDRVSTLPRSSLTSLQSRRPDVPESVKKSSVLSSSLKRNGKNSVVLKIEEYQRKGGAEPSRALSSS